MNRQESIIACCFVLIGIGYLFPFSAMSQPVDYWNLLFPQKNILFTITTVFMTTNLGLLFLLVFIAPHETTSSMFLIKRIRLGFLGQMLAIAAVPSMWFYEPTRKGSIGEWAIIACTAFMAMATAILDSSVIALSGSFSVRCQEALQLGVGLSTLIGSLYRVLTKLAFPETDAGIVQSSLVYFYTGSATIVLCIGVFGYMLSFPHAQNCLGLVPRDTEAYNSDIHSNEENNSCSSATIFGSSSGSVDVTLKEELEPLLDTDSGFSEEPPFSTKAAFRKSLNCGLCITLLFMSTLAVWPALISSIPSYQFPQLNSTKWWPLILLTLFSSTDVLGRSLVSWRLGITAKTIHRPVLLRLLVVPVLISLVKGWWHVIQHDAVSVVATVFAGLTNGWCGSLTILLMVGCADSEREKRLFGMWASFYLNGGLVLGAWLGFAVELLLLQK